MLDDNINLRDITGYKKVQHNTHRPDMISNPGNA